MRIIKSALKCSNISVVVVIILALVTLWSVPPTIS